MKLLIVDRDESTIKAISQVLLEMEKDLEFKAVADLNEAKNYLTSQQFDLLIAAGGCVKDLAPFVKKECAKRVVLMTGHAPSKAEQLAKELNTSEVLYKPFDIEKLLKHIFN